MSKLIALIGASICVCGLAVACFGLAVVINYYLWNFILFVFNTGYSLSWPQAVGVSLILMILKDIFGKGRSSND